MEKKKILIIEDENDMREIYRMILQSYDNVEVIEAYDGKRGFELAKQEKPDLIILDNKMPVMAGEHSAKFFRSDPATKNIPIVMITALTLDKQAEDLIKLDVDAYIKKPITPWQLRQTVEDYLGTLTEKI